LVRAQEGEQKGLQKCKPFFIGSHCSTRLLNNLIFYLLQYLAELSKMYQI